MKNAVVTGATGFLGSALVGELLSRDMVVFGVGTDEEKLAKLSETKGFVPICSEFSQYDDLPQMVSSDEVDVFYHFAWAGGFTSAIKDYRLQLDNASHAADALMAAVGMGARRFVYANTYNQYEIARFLEADRFEPRPTCIYSAGKTAASLICRTLAHEHGIEYCAGLIPMPYGVGNRSRQLVNIVLDDLTNGRSPRLIEGNNLYDIVHVDDIARAFVAIGEHGVDRREYYVGHRVLKTFREWMEEMRDAIAPSIALGFGEYHDNQQIDYSKVDLEALYRDTGFECREDFRIQIAKAAEWVKSLGW